MDAEDSVRAAVQPMRVDWLQVLQVPLRMAHALQVIRSADALARRGHRVRLFLRGGGPAETAAAIETALGRPGAPGLETVRLAAHKGVAGVELRAHIARFAARGRDPRARCAWVARERALAAFALRATRVLRSRAALVYELHNLEHVLAAEAGRASDAERLRLAKRLRIEERALAQRAHGLVAISAPLAADATAALEPARPIRLVPDGVDPRVFDVLEPPRCLERAPVRLGYAGSLYSHKGVDTLLDMAEELARSAGPGAFLLRIAGGEPAAELERLCGRARELAARGAEVEFVGGLDPRAVPAFLRAADLLVLPAGAESRAQRYTSPLKLFEALASGVPVVAAPSVAHASVLEHGRTAFLAASSRGVDLAAAVRAAAADPEFARRVARAARVEAERYTWERRAESLEAALAEALVEAGSAAGRG